MTATLEATQPQITPIGGAGSPAVKPASSDKTGSFTFSDLLDVINPLQHIPVVDTIYRSLTGDTISPAARIAGDTLYGGVFGLAGSIVDSLVEGETGKDIGSHIMATLFGDDDATATAANSAGPVPDATAAVGVVVPNAAAATAPQTAPVSQAAPAAAAAMGPTNYFSTLQRGGHVSHGVPLNASIPQPARSSAPTGTPSPMANAQTQTQTAVMGALPAAGAAPMAQGAVTSGPASLLPGSNATAPVGPMSSNQGDAALVQSVPGNALPAMMMKALDKYRTLETQRSEAVAQTNSAALMN